MKRIKRFFTLLILLLIVVFLLGPKPEKPELNKDLPSISVSVPNLDRYIKKQEADLPLKPDNQSRIIWANDSLKERTDYCVLYLHGFSASWFEGAPVHQKFARHFNCNLYIPRLHDHGLQTSEALIDMTPDKLWESAKSALMVARSLGKKVIIMSTSTGGTLGLKLAADFPEYVEGLYLFSPNIRINNSSAFVLTKPWGLQIARLVTGGKYRITNNDFGAKECEYWNCKYRLEAVVFLQQLVEATMKKDTYKNVTAPVFLGYYYKDEAHQDETVRVDAMLEMFEQLGTSDDKKFKKAFPNANTHVIACDMFSSSVDDLFRESIRFGEEVLGL